MGNFVIVSVDGSIRRAGDVARSALALRDGNVDLIPHVHLVYVGTSCVRVLDDEDEIPVIRRSDKDFAELKSTTCSWPVESWQYSQWMNADNIHCDMPTSRLRALIAGRGHALVAAIPLPEGRHPVVQHVSHYTDYTQ